MIRKLIALTALLTLTLAACIPTGGSIVDRQRGDRRYIRVERPE